MNGKPQGRLPALFLSVLLLAGLVALCLILLPPTVETSLFALVGEEQVEVPAAVRDRSVGQIQVLFSGARFEETLELAGRFERGMDRSAFDRIRLKTGEGELSAILAFYRESPAGLLSPADRRLLQEGKHALLTRKSLQALFSSPLPGLFPFEEDPFGLLNRFVAGLPLSFSGWHTRQGYLSAREGDREYLLMVLTLSPEVTADLDRLAAAVDGLRALRHRLGATPGQIAFCGVPMHTADVASRCRGEIQILSIFSLLFIAGLALLIFRSFRFLVWIALSLTLSCLGGFLVLILLFRSFHLIACLFATTLLGLTVDYSFHWLLTATGPELPRIRKGLLASWLTTELCFLPLALSGIAVLRQTALFMAAGLTLALACVLFFYPRACGNSRPWNTVARPLRWLVPLLLLPLAAGLFSLRFHTDIAAFHRPSAELLASESLFRRLSGTDDLARGLLVVHGRTLEEVLEREERIGLPESKPRLSRFLPSLLRRQGDQARVEALYRSQARTLAESLNLARPLAPPEKPAAWEVDRIPRVMLEPFLLREGEGYCSVIPQVEPAGEWPEGVAFYAPRQVLGRMMERYTGSCLTLLCLSGLALMILLFILFRRRAWLIALPSLVATLSIFSLLTLLGETVNLFHLLACFMVIGMSLDYTIFLASDFRIAQKPVLCSLLTSLAGFGALAFVSFPLVQFIGQALGIGLLVSFLTAYSLLMPRREGTEQGASLLGMETIWLVYRVFGKRVADLLCALVASGVWLTHPRVRRATGYRRLLNFTRALIDKLVIAARGRGAPAVELERSRDAGSFLSDIDSGRGVFVISSHLGNIEALPALGRCSTTFHAFMKVEQTALFNAFFKRHAARPEVQIHPITGFGMAELFQFGDLLDRGECLLMAGDRGGGRMRDHPFMGGRGHFPVGVFKLAELLEHPVYFVACIAVRRGLYRAVVRRLPRDRTLFECYVAELERLVKAYPDQWYQWEGGNGNG